MSINRGKRMVVLSGFLIIVGALAADDEEEAPPSSRRMLAPGAELKPHPLVLIPYYAWAHRGEGEMTVWLFRK